MPMIGALLAAVLVLAASCAGLEQADDAAETAGDPSASQEPSADDEVEVSRAGLSSQADAAVASLTSAMQTDAAEEECIVEEFLAHLEQLESFDPEDPAQIRVALRLAQSCLGDETVVRATAAGILTDVPQLDAPEARCAAEGMNEDEDFFVEMILHDVNGTPLSADGVRVFLQVMRDCDLGHVLADEIVADTGLPTESVDCVVDAVIADDVLVLAMAEDDLDQTQDPAVLAAVFGIFRTCGMSAALAEDIFGDLPLSDAQATCAVDQILALPPERIAELTQGDGGGSTSDWGQLLADIGAACDITLLDLIGG